MKNRRKLPQQKKAIYEIPTANSYSVVKDRFSAKISKKAKMSIIPSSIQHSTRSHNQTNYARKEIKDFQIGKKEVEFSLFINDVSIYRKC